MLIAVTRECFFRQGSLKEVSMFLDVERFLTQVLGKVSNLPGDVNKERLELTEKLQKFLKLPEKDSSKRKPPPPLPSKPSPAEEEVCLMFHYLS